MNDTSIDRDEDTSPLPQWFAISTAPRHEKRVSERLAERQVEAFLPVYHAERQWKKRAPVVLELPLFPSYLFARIGPSERGTVLSLPGVLSIVGNGKRAIPVPQSEVEALRGGLNLRKAEPHPHLAIGERVRIKSGPLAGFEGLLVRRKNLLRVVLSVELIMRSVSVEVEISEVEPAATLAYAHVGQSSVYLAT